MGKILKDCPGIGAAKEGYVGQCEAGADAWAGAEAGAGAWRLATKRFIKRLLSGVLRNCLNTNESLLMEQWYNFVLHGIREDVLPCATKELQTLSTKGHAKVLISVLTQITTGVLRFTLR